MSDYKFEQGQTILWEGHRGKAVRKDRTAAEPSWFVEWFDGLETSCSFPESEMKTWKGSMA